MITTPTLKLLTLFNYLYEREGVTVQSPEDFIVPLASNPKVVNDVIQMLDIAQALRHSIISQDSSQ